ncbi:hypothetical protein D560_3847 [Bordetella holmesii ATCC 51541]|nr:hypothetical protein D560_3847 [Bordetella holmesii ATCC 51541]
MTQQFTAFDGMRRVAQGSLAEVALALHDRPKGQVLVFNDHTGRQIDLDPRLTATSATFAPLALADPAQEGAAFGRGRGRPRLGWSPARSRSCRATGIGWRNNPAARR